MTSSRIFSIKTAAASVGAIAAATVAVMAAPGAAAFIADEMPRAYSELRAWLTPPYLYFVINCIIISIAASSRFHKADDPSAPVGSEAEPPPIVAPAEFDMRVEPPEDPHPAFYVTAAEYEPETEVQIVPESETPVAYSTEAEKPVAETPAPPAEETEAEEFVISRSSWTPKQKESIEIPPEYSLLAPEKPLVSARFSQQRRSPRPNPDGKALGVARQKRGETLENTWKTITDGRAVPLARHLKKSDTWGEAQGRGRQDEAEPAALMKSETFVDRGGRPPLSPASSGGSGRLRRESSSGGSGKLRREASLGQDDLNRRVEAFINKFNEEMRLQRQRSCQQYLEMMKREIQKHHRPFWFLGQQVLEQYQAINGFTVNNLLICCDGKYGRKSCDCS